MIRTCTLEMGTLEVELEEQMYDEDFGMDEEIPDEEFIENVANTN